MAKTQEKRTFLFNLEWKKALEDYPPEIRLEVYEGIMEYALTGIVPELSPLSKMAFSFIKQGLDFNNEKYEQTCSKRSKAGKEGADKRWNANPDGKNSKCHTDMAKMADNDNENDSDNENDDFSREKSAHAQEGECRILSLDEIKGEINAAQAKAEGLCMSYGITPEEYGAIKAEIFAEWEMQGYSAVLSDAMNYFVNLMRIKAKDRQKQPKPPDIPLRDRQKALWNEIIGCGVQCPADTQKAFYAKWSETDASGVFMKCELENGFDVKRRLERYVINSQH